MTGSSRLGRPRGDYLPEFWKQREIGPRGWGPETRVLVLNLRHAVKCSRVC